MVIAEDLQCLKAIALMGGCRGAVFASSQKIATTLDISPQTASRRLISLENQGFINRSIHADGQYLAVTTTGEEALRQEYSDYCRIFSTETGHFILEGELIDGLGEGRYYVSITGYHDQFVEKLGFDPYPGTLNVKLNPAGIETRKKLDGLDWILIKGFNAENRTFGNARCLRCFIGDYPCAIVVPGRSHNADDVIELISPVELRKAMNLNTRDRVTVRVDYD